MNAAVQQKNETSPLDRKSLKSTCENESSDIELPDMFEYDNWWLEAETPMTDQCLSAFLKKHMWAFKYYSVIDFSEGDELLKLEFLFIMKI